MLITMVMMMVIAMMIMIMIMKIIYDDDHKFQGSLGGGVIQTTASESTFVCLLAGRSDLVDVVVDDEVDVVDDVVDGVVDDVDAS